MGKSEKSYSKESYLAELYLTTFEICYIVGHLKIKAATKGCRELTPFLRNVCVVDFSTDDLAKVFDRKCRQLTHIRHILSHYADERQLMFLLPD